jgi:Chromatin modification-related protein EAF7
MTVDNNRAFLGSVEGEISFFRSIMRARPIGIHRHFHVLAIQRFIQNDTGRVVHISDIWDKLKSCYNLDALEAIVRIPILEEPLTDLNYAQHRTRKPKLTSCLGQTDRPHHPYARRHHPLTFLHIPTFEKNIRYRRTSHLNCLYPNGVYAQPHPPLHRLLHPPRLLLANLVVGRNVEGQNLTWLVLWAGIVIAVH